MTIRSLVLAVFLLPLAFVVSAQDPATAGGGKALVGKWTGKWLSDGRSRASGDMQMELVAEADRVTGRVMFVTSATPPCLSEWQKFAGGSEGGKVSAQVDLQGRCGKVNMMFWIDPKDKDVLTGTYSSEYPDKGRIHLTRQ